MNDFTYYKDHDFEKGRKYIGASDIPTLSLMNTKYGQTPYTLFQEITGRTERKYAGERAKAGKELEPLVLKFALEKIPEFELYAKNYYISRISENNYFREFHNFTEAVHPERPYLLSHADLLETSMPVIVEAKTTGFFGALRKNDIDIGYDEFDLSANGIPASVYLQIQTQMLTYDVTTAYVSAQIDTGVHRLYGPIHYHKKTQEKILALAERFWWHIENDKEPKPEIWSDVVSQNPVLQEDSKEVVGGESEQEVIEMKERAKILRKKEKEIKKELKDLKNAVGIIIGKNKYLESAEGRNLATQFEVNKFYAKLKDLEKDHPRKFKNLLEDGYIYESSYRDMRF
jgi:hypothetical protein